MEKRVYSEMKISDWKMEKNKEEDAWNAIEKQWIKKKEKSHTIKKERQKEEDNNTMRIYKERRKKKRKNENINERTTC